MHSNYAAAEAQARQMIALCRRGFNNEHAWMAWRKAHAAEIEALPLDLRNRVCLAWDNASAKEFSR
jgi:hypothetical protein